MRTFLTILIVTLFTSVTHAQDRVTLERLQILATERAAIAADLSNTAKGEEAVARLEADLAAIDREIALVGKGQTKTTKDKPKAVKEASQTKAPRSDEIKQSYAEWDVFKDFGQ